MHAAYLATNVAVPYVFMQQPRSHDDHVDAARLFDVAQ